MKWKSPFSVPWGYAWAVQHLWNLGHNGVLKWNRYTLLTVPKFDNLKRQSNVEFFCVGLSTRQILTDPAPSPLLRSVWLLKQLTSLFFQVSICRITSIFNLILHPFTSSQSKLAWLNGRKYDILKFLLYILKELYSRTYRRTQPLFSDFQDDRRPHFIGRWRFATTKPTSCPALNCGAGALPRYFLSSFSSIMASSSSSLDVTQIIRSVCGRLLR